jgi:hypothetical protein
MGVCLPEREAECRALVGPPAVVAGGFTLRRRGKQIASSSIAENESTVNSPVGASCPTCESASWSGVT